jgi:xanthine dehydrogenase YagS FAD-binding subunit
LGVSGDGRWWAASIALTGAPPLSQYGFKVDLAKHSVVRALTLAAERT